MHKIYIVEDQLELQKLVVKYLLSAGYEVKAFSNGQEAILHVEDNPSLWILDIMLGDDVSGYDIIKSIREKNSVVPVIFTSARDQEVDRILGLEMGSDDYITKPFSNKELVLRVNNIINRVYGHKENSIVYDDYTIDKNKRQLKESDNEIKLTTLEFNLVIFLLEHKDAVFTREDLITAVWGENDYSTDRAVDDLIRRIRKKLPQLRIETVYGYGYRLL